MGLGAWLAAVTDEGSRSTRKRESAPSAPSRPLGEGGYHEVFTEYNIPRTSLMPLADHLVQNCDLWIKVSSLSFPDMLKC